jgi:hypothetical protein
MIDGWNCLRRIKEFLVDVWDNTAIPIFFLLCVVLFGYCATCGDTVYRDEMCAIEGVVTSIGGCNDIGVCAVKMSSGAVLQLQYPLVGEPAIEKGKCK